MMSGRDVNEKRKKRRRQRRAQWLLLLASVLLMVLCAVKFYQDIRRTEALYGNFSTAYSDGESSAWVNDRESIAKELEELLAKNPEIYDFVTGYADREEYLGQTIDLSEDYIQGKVPLLMQWDRRWGYESLGDTMIGLGGCGPTCLSMAYLYFTGDMEGNPREMSSYCEANGFYTAEGTEWSLWTLGMAGLGLSGRELPLSESVMRSALDGGELIVCSMRPGDFTTTGHYILIRGYDENGFLVNDPNRRENSDRQWTYEELDGQIKNLWALSGGEEDQ